MFFLGHAAYHSDLHTTLNDYFMSFSQFSVSFLGNNDVKKIEATANSESLLNIPILAQTFAKLSAHCSVSSILFSWQCEDCSSQSEIVSADCRSGIRHQDIALIMTSL